MAELRAGYELDALIAEKVMGWTPNGMGYDAPDGKFRTAEPTSFGAFQPSTDIAAAWEVAERFQMLVTPDADRGGWVAGPLEQRSDYVDGEMGIIDARLSVSVTAATAPLAICLAALKAVDAGVRA